MQLSILLLASDRPSVQGIANALTRPGHGVTVVTNPVDAVTAASGYSVLIADGITAPVTVGDLVTMLRAAGVAIPVLAVARTPDLEERITLLEMGADDVIVRPFAVPELMARVEALSLHTQSPVSGSRTAIGEDGRHRLIAVFSPKGGVGTTTVATNLAIIAAETHPGQVLLLDLDLSFGQVASHLNIQPTQTLLELTRDEAALHDADLFRTYVIHQPGGLHVIAAPPSPSFSALITAEHIELTLARAVEAYEIVVADAGTALDQRLATIFTASRTVVVPVIPEIPALHSVHMLLDQLAETGGAGGQTVFVLNNTFARDLLKASDVETALGYKVSADLPYDPIVYLKAVNEGNPVVRSAPKSAPAQKLRALAATVFGGSVRPSAVDESRKDRRGIFGRR